MKPFRPRLSRGKEGGYEKITTKEDCWCLDAVKRFGVGVPWLNGLAGGTVQFARGHPARIEQRVTLHVVKFARGGHARI